MSFVRQAERIAARLVDGKAIVIVIDERTMHTLDEVGSFVWSAVGADGRSVRELVQDVTSEFDVGRARAEQDLNTFIERLVELRAVVVTES